MTGSGQRQHVTPDPAQVPFLRPANTATCSPNAAYPPANAPCHAVVVIDRQTPHDHAAATEPLPSGWNWMLANSRLPSILESLLAEAGLPWLTTILPQEQASLFASIGSTDNPPPSLLSFDEHIRLPSHLVTPTPRGQPACLILNGHQFPLCDFRRILAVHRRRRCDVTLVDLTHHASPQYSESVIVRPDGHVERIERLYSPPGASALSPECHWPSFIIVSPQAIERLQEIPLPCRLNQWPSVLLRLGLRLHGATAPGACLDLHQRESLHTLAAHLLLHKPACIHQGQLRELSPRIWIGKEVQIAGDTQLVGPLAIGDGAHIGPRAMIVGPAVIARGAHVGADVILRHTCLLPGSIITTTQSTHPPPLNSKRLHRPMHLHPAARDGASHRLHPRRRIFPLAKRAIDIVVALTLLILTLPCYAVIAAAININSPGPVFYAHVRQGRGGKNFKCWKFRTMVPDADRIKAQLASLNEVDGPQFKMKNDPRIFRVGRFLRRYNIDEWPQFFNVLLGQMSLVGPRPSPERENRMCPAWREARLSVRPGLTGLWQVCREREEETDFQEWIHYDMQYVKNQSLWLDLKILFWTLRVALRGG